MNFRGKVVAICREKSEGCNTLLAAARHVLYVRPRNDPERRTTAPSVNTSRSTHRRLFKVPGCAPQATAMLPAGEYELRVHRRQILTRGEPVRFVGTSGLSRILLCSPAPIADGNEACPS